MNTVDFSPDGRRIVSGGEDGTVRVWDPSGGAALVTLRDHGGEVYSVEFSPDGGQDILSAAADGTVRISGCEVCGSLTQVLRLARARAVRALTPAEQQRLSATTP